MLKLLPETTVGGIGPHALTNKRNEIDQCLDIIFSPLETRAAINALTGNRRKQKRVLFRRGR